MLGKKFYFLSLLLVVFSCPPCFALTIEFEGIQQFSDFSITGNDINRDGYLVYDEVERLISPLYNKNCAYCSDYEYMIWGVFDIDQKRFLNDHFSAWDVPTMPNTYSHEEWVAHLIATSLGSSDNYAIEDLSTGPAPPMGGSIINFNGNFSNYYNVRVTDIPEPAIWSILLLALVANRASRSAQMR